MCCLCFFFFQAEDGIRDLVRSRGLGDVYKRQRQSAGRLAESERNADVCRRHGDPHLFARLLLQGKRRPLSSEREVCLLYTSDAADERSSVDLGGRRIIKKKKQRIEEGCITVTAGSTEQPQRPTRHDNGHSIVST